MSAAQPRTFTLNGLHILAAFLAFFGIIIAVNLTMARFAVTYWTGLVVKNSYVASQEFNDKIAAHDEILAHGWVETVSVAEGKLNWTLRDKSGKPVAADQLVVRFNRPIGENGDAEQIATRLPDGTFAPLAFPASGRWIVTIKARIPGVAGLESVHRFNLASGA
jgi:nitrogen fixation protein FixH